MADHDRYDDRRYRDQDRNRDRARDDYGPSDDADARYSGGYGSDYRGEYSYGRPRGDFERAEDQRSDQRSYAPYGTSGPVRTGRGAYDGDGHPRFGYGGRDRRAGHHTPNVRDGRGEEARSWWDRTTDTLSSWLGDDDARRRHRWDEVSHGGDPYAGPAEHRGRGPQGYRRSDPRIHEDVNDHLTDDPYLDASQIEVTVANSEVTLSGLIMRREDKRRAEMLAESVSGVTHVQNNLRLKPDAGLGGLTPDSAPLL